MMKNTTVPESKASARKSVRSKSKEKAPGNTPTSQRPPDPRVGTRSVNTLSDAQLERKRANDREAQRIIRQRTREHIENLERQVAELGEQKEQLNKALQHNAELEAQIGHLQQRLAEMALLLQYRQSPGVPEYADTTPIYTARSCVPLSSLAPSITSADQNAGHNALAEPGIFPVPVSHGYVVTSSMEARSLYTPYDLQVPIHSHISHPSEPKSSAASIASTSFTDEAEVAAMTAKYNVLPGSSAASMHAYAHQGLPPTSMATPGSQYHYPAAYNTDPWNPNRSG
jgi:hypothetical protein